MYYDIVESGKRIQELRTVDLLINISACFDVTLDFLILGKERSNEAAQNMIQSLIEQMEALKKQL